MLDSNPPSGRSLLGGLSPSSSTTPSDVWDERILDEPLASGQRKRYLASLKPGAAKL